MLITRTPYRISFFGGGTDFPQWYKQYGGAVISTTINKYSFLVIRRLPDIFDYRYRIRYYKREECNSIETIEHPVVRAGLQKFNLQDGIDITHHGDLPSRSGVGSSSSFTVGLLHGLNALTSQYLGKRQLATEAIDLEQNVLHESVGSQDQVATVFGGFNRINFGGQQEFECLPLTIPKENQELLEQSILLIYLEQPRSATTIESKKIELISRNRSILLDMLSLVDEAEKLIYSQSGRFIEDFALLLNQQWELKKQLSDEVSNTFIEDVYKSALSNGALGGKLLGAGGGGFFMFICPNDKRAQIIERLGLKAIDVTFSSVGSNIIYFSASD